MKSFKISPLGNKKYYGTKIVDESGRDVLIVWGVSIIGKPSKRERNQWDSDEPYEMCDSHYEDEGDYRVAKVIVEALNNYFAK